MKRIELPNIIGSRKILKDIRAVADKHYVDARVMWRMAKDSNTDAEFEYWRTKAVEHRDFARELDAFIDIYKII